jgi:hypothetical protein
VLDLGPAKQIQDLMILILQFLVNSIPVAGAAYVLIFIIKRIFKELVNTTNQAKGLKSVALKPELIKLIQRRPEFFESLCEEGVVDWLESFVIKKQNSKPLEQ